MQSTSLDDLRLLAQLARHTTFLEAGRRLGIATTTVSRRIAALEAGVGAQLVNRTHTGTVLTAVGMRLVASTQTLTMELEAAVRSACGADSQITGHLKVSVVEGLVPLAINAIEAFRNQHSGVTFSLDGSNRALDMSSNEADVALRTLKPGSEGLVVRAVGAIHYGVYASGRPSASRKVGSLSAVLARSEAVVLGGELSGLKESVWLRQRAQTVVLEVETLGGLMDAVRQGIGVGVIPDELAVRDQTLRRLGDCDGVRTKTLWLVMNRRTAKLARVRQFAQHMTEHLRATMAGKST